MTKTLTDRALHEHLPSWGVLMLESHHSESFSMDWRTHSFIKLVYVLHGRGCFHIAKSRWQFEAGDVIVISPGTRNRIEDDANSASSLYVCCIAKSLLKFDPKLLERIPNRLYHRDGDFTHRVASRLRRMVHAQDSQSPSRPVAMVADAIKLIQVVDQRNLKPIRSEKEASDERLVVKRYIESLPSRFFEATSIDSAADQLGIPRRTFTKLFTELTGETWLHRVRSLAIQHAQRRLEQSDLPITSIAFECGFNDLSTFYRQFKRQCGVAPGEFRAQHGSQSPMR
jgi:AraC family L-rhamnose operon regulatory protein RhaS